MREVKSNDIQQAFAGTFGLKVYSRDAWLDIKTKSMVFTCFCGDRENPRKETLEIRLRLEEGGGSITPKDLRSGCKDSGRWDAFLSGLFGADGELRLVVSYFAYGCARTALRRALTDIEGQIGCHAVSDGDAADILELIAKGFRLEKMTPQ